MKAVTGTGPRRTRAGLLKVVAWAALGGLSACAAGAGGARPEAAGRQRSDRGDYHAVTIVSAGGRATPLSEVLGTRPALVSFWAPWCEPCLREMPDIERLSQSARSCAVSVLGVAVGETPDAVAAFVAAHHLTVPQFADEHYALADALGQTRVPTTVVFDRGQRVTFVGQRVDSRATEALSAAARADGAPAEPDCALALMR